MGFLKSPPTFWIGALEALCGTLVFPSLFHFSVLVIRYLLRKRRKSIPDCDLLDISNKLVSGIFAGMSVSVGLNVLSSCGDEVMKESHPAVRHHMCFGLPYFLYDIYSMYLVYSAGQKEPQTRNPWSFVHARKVMVLHHLLIPFFGFPIFMSYRRSLGDCLIAVAFCMEASTPFVSLRAILHHLGLKSSNLYLVNGLLMNVVFFCCRILVFPFIYQLYARECGLSLVQLILSKKVPLFCTSSMLLLLLPQLYWFSLMLKGSFRVIHSRISPDKDR